MVCEVYLNKAVREKKIKPNQTWLLPSKSLQTGQANRGVNKHFQLQAGCARWGALNLFL